MKTACEIRKDQWGKTSFVCVEKRMRICERFSAVANLPGMCEHNLDPSEMKGSPEEITDFCFCAEVRHAAKANAPDLDRDDEVEDAVEPDFTMDDLEWAETYPELNDVD
jgi:hypothetical protein